MHGIGPNILKGFIPGQLHIPDYYQDIWNKQVVWSYNRLLFVVEESNKFTSVHFLIDTEWIISAVIKKTWTRENVAQQFHNRGYHQYDKVVIVVVK